MTIYSPQVVGAFWCASEFSLAMLKRSKSNAVSKDRHSVTAIWLMNLFAVALGIVASARFPACELPWPKLIPGLGASLLLLGFALRWYSIIHLGRFFTVDVAIASDHHLVDSGPYHFVRHPSYAGNLLVVAGFALSFQNWVSLLAVFGPCAAVILWRIRIEESALLEALGEPYRRYMLRTKRLIPFIF